jgi:hypothetical protein
MSAELPEHIQKDVARQTELEWELKGIEMTNVYDKDMEWQIKLNARRIQVLRELAEVGGRIDRYIDQGRQNPNII